jgi:endoglucanase
MPTDPLHQLVLSLHTYSGQACIISACWNAVAAGAAAANVPVITGEFGDLNNTANYITSFMQWADLNNFSYLAWSWQAGTAQLDLVTNWAGNPNPPEGPVLKTHLLCVYNNPGNVQGKCDK